MDNNAKLRPLYLAKILYERTDEDHYLTTMQLAQILEEEYGIPAHRQTIKTDIELLQQFGMDIQEVKSTQNRYNLISRQFEIAELKLLIDAVQSSKFIPKERSEQMVSKIVALAGQHKAEELKRNASVEGRTKSENRQDLLIVDAINEAINAEKKIAFQYFSYNVRKQKKLRHDGERLALSKAFVERAERLGIEHDEKYRNLNGMKMMFQNVAYVASNGDHGMSAASSAMRKVYDMSNSSPEVFDLILKEFTKRYLT